MNLDCVTFWCAEDHFNLITMNVPQKTTIEIFYFIKHELNRLQFRSRLRAEGQEEHCLYTQSHVHLFSSLNSNAEWIRVLLPGLIVLVTHSYYKTNRWSSLSVSLLSVHVSLHLHLKETNMIIESKINEVHLIIINLLT